MSDGNVYGPADIASLVSWAEDGRIDPSSSLSKDRIRWTPAQLMGELEMKWLVELEPGKPLGPYNRRSSRFPSRRSWRRKLSRKFLLRRL